LIEPRLFLCSGARISGADPVTQGRKQIELNSADSNPNVNIRFENVARVFQRHLSSRLTDLLEIAAYVYAADCSAQRGKQWMDGYSAEPWSRDFAFAIAVREPDFGVRQRSAPSWRSCSVFCRMTGIRSRSCR